MALPPLISPATKLRIDEYRQKYGVPGVSIALVVKRSEGDDVPWESETLGLGIRDREDRPVEADTIFCIASTSKLFTAFSIGILIDRKTKLPNGKLLAWDTKIKDVLPWWELQDKWAETHLDIGDLLSHMSGLPRHDILRHTEDPDPHDTVRRLKDVKLSAEPRKKHQYANINYYTVGQVISTLSGIPFIDFVKQNILDPLGMTESTYGDTLGSGKRSDAFYHIGRDQARGAEALKKGEWDRESLVGRAENLGWWVSRGTGEGFAAAGSLSTTANDQVKWIKELLHPTIFPSSILKEVVKSRVAAELMPGYPDFGVTTYGYGQGIMQYRGHRIENHGGGLSGQTCFHVRIPGKCGMIAMTNDNDFGYSVALLSCLRIIDDILGLPPVDWEERMLLKGLKEVEKQEELPASPRPPPQDISGEYFDAAYGDLKVTKLEDDANGSILRGLLDKYPIAHFKADRKAQVYVADTDRLLQSHLLFLHFDGPIYVWLRVVLRKIIKPKGNLTHLVEFWGKGKAVATRDGIGMFESYWALLDAGPSRKVKEENVSEEAEIWYARK